MGIGDFVDKAKDVAADNKDKVKEGVDKAHDVVDEKTGGKYDEHTDKGADAAKDFVDDLEDE